MTVAVGTIRSPTISGASAPRVDGHARLVVAFGGSIAAGEGDVAPVGVSKHAAYHGYVNGTWTDSPQSYAAEVARSAGWKVANFSISGACSMRSTCPPSHKARPTIIDDELPAAAKLGLSPRLVTVMIGANDVSFEGCGLGLLGWLGSVNKEPCQGTIFQQRVRQLTSNVTHVLSAIRSLYPGVPIALSLYFNPVPDRFSANPSSACSAADAPVLGGIYQFFNGARNWHDLVGLFDPTAAPATRRAVEMVLKSVNATSGRVTDDLNAALTSAAKSVAAVQTVPFDITGHGPCEDYLGGKDAYVFGPRIHLTGTYVRGLSATTVEQAYAPLRRCTTFDGGCTSFRKAGSFAWPGSVPTGKTKGRFSFHLSVGMNDLPHLTPDGQFHMAGLVERAERIP